MKKLDLNKIKNFRIDTGKRKTMLIIVSLSLGFMVLYFQFFLKTTLRQFFTVTPELRELKSEMKRMNEDLGYEDILKKRLDDMQDRVDYYEKKLPAEQEVPLLLGELSNMARESFVKISGISPISMVGAKKGKKVYHEIPIMIKAKSGYHEVGTFINKLENANRFMEISDIRMSADPQDARRHDMELIVSTYTLSKEGK